jgi:hypothetical protein
MGSATEPTPFVPRARRCEMAESFEFFLNELSVLPLHRPQGQVCGEVMISPSFWTLPKLFHKTAFRSGVI